MFASQRVALSSTLLSIVIKIKVADFKKAFGDLKDQHFPTIPAQANKAKDAETVATTLDVLYREESRRVFATLVRLINDFDLAAEALQEGFAAALDQWQRDGIPANPRAWLVHGAV